MKKYLLFAGHHYYPSGGFDDFFGDFKSINDAKEWFGLNPDKISASYLDHWCHVVDKDTFKIVSRFEQKFIGNISDKISGPVTIAEDEA